MYQEWTIRTPNMYFLPSHIAAIMLTQRRNQMTIKVKVTRAGFTSCPSCLSHIRVESELNDVECPFCGEALAISIQQPVGQATMSVLRKSRSGLVAAALAGGLMFAACSDEDPDKTNNANNTVDMEPDFVEEPINNQDYAGGPNNFNNINNSNNLNNLNNTNNVEDMGNSDMTADG